MKRTYLACAVVGAMSCLSAFAGPPSTTTVQTTSSACGVGWYFGLEGGANVYQDFGSDRHIDINGNDVSFGINDHTGGFGGIKFGYVFGPGEWRFALEEDWYYNGVDAQARVRVNGGPDIATVDAQFNTGAFMTNLVLRYAPNGGCGFQPYIFGGIGGWWGETGGDVDITVNGVTRSLGSADNGGFAFQAGAGLDYYFNPKWSIFTEYKFVDYTNAGGTFTGSNIGQHLVGGGFKVHF